MAPRSPSYHVVEAVAREEEVPPTRLSPPLNDVLDADALDKLVAASQSAGDVSVEFEYRDYVVRVTVGDPVDVSVRTDSSTPASNATSHCRVGSDE